MLLLKYYFPSLSSFRLESPFTALTRAFRSFFVNSLFCHQNLCCCKMCKGWHNYSHIFILKWFKDSDKTSQITKTTDSKKRRQISLSTHQNEFCLFLYSSSFNEPRLHINCDSCKYLIILFEIFHQSFAQKLIWDDANISLQKVKYGPWRTTISCANSTFEVRFSLCKTMQWS